MNSRQFLILSASLISIHILNYLAIYFYGFSLPFVNWFYIIGFYLGYKTIISYSDFSRTPFLKILYIFFAITLVGLIIKLEHWTTTGPILIIGISGIAITYSVRFIRKKTKGFSDYLKIIWVICYCLSQLVIIQHLDSEGIVGVLPKILFLILVFYYIDYDKKLKEEESQLNEFLNQSNH